MDIATACLIAVGLAILLGIIGYQQLTDRFDQIDSDIRGLVRDVEAARVQDRRDAHTIGGMIQKVEQDTSDIRHFTDNQ